MHILKGQEINHNESSLKIDFVINNTKIENHERIRSREVVRGISIIGNKLLVVYPKNQEIYGTPGGGIDEGEDRLSALKRELREEVGALDIDVVEYLGKMSSIRYSPRGEVFNPIHHYYLVKINKFGKQELLDYEKDLDLQFDYIDIDKIINKNLISIKDRNQAFLDFYSDQVVLFQELKKIDIFK